MSGIDIEGVLSAHGGWMCERVGDGWRCWCVVSLLDYWPAGGVTPRDTALGVAHRAHVAAVLREQIEGDLAEAWEVGRAAERHHAAALHDYSHWSSISAHPPTDPPNPYPCRPPVRHRAGGLWRDVRLEPRCLLPRARTPWQPQQPMGHDVGRHRAGWGCGMSEVRGRCSVCGATYAIRRDGMVRHHDNGLIFEGYRVCAGSGRPPTTSPLPNPSANEGEQPWLRHCLAPRRTHVPAVAGVGITPSTGGRSAPLVGTKSASHRPVRDAREARRRGGRRVP